MSIAKTKSLFIALCCACVCLIISLFAIKPATKAYATESQYQEQFLDFEVVNNHGETEFEDNTFYKLYFDIDGSVTIGTKNIRIGSGINAITTTEDWKLTISNGQLDEESINIFSVVGSITDNFLVFKRNNFNNSFSIDNVTYVKGNSLKVNLNSTPHIVKLIPGTDTPGTDEPGTDTPGTDEPGTDTPGTDTPGTDTPGTDTPGTDTPGTDENDYSNVGKSIIILGGVIILLFLYFSKKE